MAAIPRSRVEREQFAAGQRYAHERLPAWRETYLANTHGVGGMTPVEMVTLVCERRGSSEMFRLGALDIARRWWDKP